MVLQSASTDVFQIDHYVVRRIREESSRVIVAFREHDRDDTRWHRP